MNNLNTKSQYTPNHLITVLLYFSFIWVGLYPALSSIYSNFYYSFGNVLDSASSVFSSVIVYVIVQAFVSWICLELIFMVYRFILSFKIYSFVLPSHKLKDEMRMFFIYRNVFLGLFLNICFIFPYLYALLGLIDLLVTMITFLCFAAHINKTYSEPLIGHFVFKSFITPVVIYEILVVVINFLEVL